MTKGAVRVLPKKAASVLGQDGMLVESVHPGGIYTSMGGADFLSEEEMSKSVYADFPIPRVCQPSEVAYVSLFLASDEATYSTGSEFVADGGWFTGMRRPGSPCA